MNSLICQTRFIFSRVPPLPYVQNLFQHLLCLREEEIGTLSHQILFKDNLCIGLLIFMLLRIQNIIQFNVLTTIFMEARSGQNYLINCLLCIFNSMSFVFNSTVERINFIACVFNFSIGPINFMLRTFNCMVWGINFMLDIFNFVTHLINFVLCVFSFMAISSHYLINAMLCLSNFKVFVIIFTLCAFNII